MSVLTFGELLLRLSPPGEERLLESPVLHTFFGGAEANVAVALRHLGVPSSFITRLPEGPLGDAGLDALEPGADLRTMRVVYDRAGSGFSQITPADVDWAAALADARWLHGTGITPALGDGPATALRDGFAAARERGVTVSLDLNYREALWRGRDPCPLIEPLARQANVLIGNRDAVRAMLGIDANGAELADRFGCRAVATPSREILGPREHAWSAVLYDSRARAVVRSHRHVVQVVDRVGGGDSFTAGLIAALLAEQSPQDAVEFAAAAGALKLGQAGDFGRSTAADVSRLVFEGQHSKE